MRRILLRFIPVAAVAIGAYMLGVVILQRQVMEAQSLRFAQHQVGTLQVLIEIIEDRLTISTLRFMDWLQYRDLAQLDPADLVFVSDQADHDVNPRALFHCTPENQIEFFYPEGEVRNEALEQAFRELPAPCTPSESASQQLPFGLLSPFQAGDVYYLSVVGYPDAAVSGQHPAGGAFALDARLIQTVAKWPNYADGLWLLDSDGRILYEQLVTLPAYFDITPGQEQFPSQELVAIQAAESGWQFTSAWGGLLVWTPIELGSQRFVIVLAEAYGLNTAEMLFFGNYLTWFGLALTIVLVIFGLRVYQGARVPLVRELDLRSDQLAMAQTHYQMLFEHSPDPIFLVDPSIEHNEWPITTVNRQVTVLLGYAPDELIGVSALSLFANPPGQEDLNWYLDELRQHKPVSFEGVLRHRDGTTIPMELSSIMLRDRGRDLILVIGRDLRPRTQVQTLQDDFEQTMFMLNQVAVDITSSLDLDDIMRELVEAGHRVFPQSLAVTVQLFEDTGDYLVTAFASEGAPNQHQKVRFRPGVGIAGLAMMEKRVINVANVRTDPRFVPGVTPPAFNSLLVAPLVSASRVWGTLSVEGIQEGAFGKREERMANMLARQAGAALENAYLYRTAQHQRQIADTLRDIGTVLTSALRQEDVLTRLIEQIGRVLHYDAASIWMVRPDGGYYRQVGVGYEKHEPETALLAEWHSDDETALHRVGRTRDVLIIADTKTSETWKPLDRDLWIRSWAGAPIIVRGELNGVFCLDHATPGFYGEEHRSILHSFAAQVSIAVENALLFEQVQNYALTLQQEVAVQTSEIRTQQERTNAILTSIEDAVLTFQIDGSITYANESACQLLGWDLEYLIGTQVLDYIHSNTIRRVQRAMVKAVRQQEPWRGEVFVQHKRDYPVLIDAAAVPYQMEDGGTTGYVASMRIMSDERVTERMKAQFMTLVSHELRTPLTNLKLHIHLLRKVADDPARSLRYLDALDSQIKRLADMMEKILAVIRLTDYETLSYNQRINLESLLDSLVVRYADAMKQKHIQLAVDSLPASELPVVYGDQHWVVLACNELIENALTYTPVDGQITISLTRFEQDHGSFLGVVVQDTGPGISPQEVRQLHAAFTRLGDQLVGDTAGIGLGLFIARSVGEQLGGGLKVESELGVGSRFTLFFPVRAE